MSTANPTRIELPVEGMSCASCATRIERKLNRLDGVHATVNYATERATVEYDPALAGSELIADTIEQTGYHAVLTPAGRAEAQPDETTSQIARRLGVSAALTAPVLALAMIPPLQFDGWQWFSLLLATIVVGWGGLPFHRAALTSLRHGTATMDTLISVGTLAALGWSVVAMLFLGAGGRDYRMSYDWTLGAGGKSDNIYLEVAAVVTTFVLTGRFFESRAKRRAGAALRALLELGAKEVSLLVDGRERRVPVEQLRVGDVFVVRPGERVATDGVVVEGRSAIDRSLLTGESIPVEVGPGDNVAGATVNAGGVRHRARPDRPAGGGRTERQGGGTTAGRPRLGGVRTDRDRALAGRAGVLAAGRVGRRLRVPGRGGRADRGLPGRARAGDADRAAGRDRPRRPTRHPDQGAGGAGADAHGDGDRAGQDRYRHRGPHERRRAAARAGGRQR
jgi:copper chaperone CopZ